MTVELTLHRAVGAKTATRLRGSITAVLDITKADPEQPDAGSYVLNVEGEQFPITAGTNVVAFEFDIPASYGDDEMEGGALSVRAIIECVDDTNVGSAWASIEITQCDALLSDSGTVANEPLTMTPIVFQGIGGGGGGGFSVVKEGALASVMEIEIVGYYNTAKFYEFALVEIYAPRWIDEADYVALGVPIALTPGSPGWSDDHISDLPDMSGLPDWDPEGLDWSAEENYTLCKVTLDGGAPVSVSSMK